jgi:hypothetical protein
MNLVQTLTHNTEPYRSDLELDPYDDPKGPDASGTYFITWPNSGLLGGKVYTVVGRIQIGSGGTFNTPTSLDITMTKEFQDMQDLVDERLDIPMSQMRSEIQVILDTQTGIITTSMDNQTDIIQTQMAEQTATIQTQMDEFSDQVESSIISLEEAATSSLASAAILEEAALLSQLASEDLQNIAKRQASRLLLPQAVVTGEPTMIRFRGYSEGLTPLMDILDFNGEAIMQAVPMMPISGKPGMYEYLITEVDAATYEPGAPVTVIVTESFTGAVESGTMFIDVAMGELLLPSTVLVGDKVIMRFRGKGDWKPTITILDYESNMIVNEAKMTPVVGKPGLFEYNIPEVRADQYVPGKPVTVTVNEPTTATMASGSFLVESTSLTTIEGLVSSGVGVKGIAKDALDAIKAVQLAMESGGDVGNALQNIQYKIAGLPKEIAKEGGITAPIVAAVNQMKEQFVDFAGGEGYDFNTLLQKGLSESSDINEIRGTTDRISGASQVMQAIIETKFGGTDEPVVQVVYE